MIKILNIKKNIYNILDRFKQNRSDNHEWIYV